MGESNESLLKVVRHCQESLDKYSESRNEGKLLHYLQKLYKLPIKVVHLEDTGVGRTVNGLRKVGGLVGDSAKSLVSKWKEMVVGEQKAQDDDEEEEDEDDDDEDGYQTGEEQSDSDESDVPEDTVETTSSSHKKSDNNRTDDRDKAKKSRSNSSKSDRSSDSSNSKKEKEKHSKHNGHHKHKSHKRKSDDSDDDTHRKRSKPSEDEDRHKRRKIDSDEERKSQERKHKSDRHKSESKKKTRESSDAESTQKSSKPKEKHKESGAKEKHKSHKNRHEHSSKTKESEKKSKHKDSTRGKSEETKSKKEKTVNGSLVKNGIDSGSGASFAEALGMCEPSSSKGSSKKKSSEKKEKPTGKTDDLVPKLLLKEPTIEPLDINISSLLPSITPNYRPLASLMSPDMQPRKFLTESETLSNIISSKNQRTKVYSGNKTGNGKVSSLFDMCIHLLQDHIDALEYTGGVPYNILKPILEKATPNQLYTMEHHNPYLIEDTDELWQLHCQKDFRNKPRQELETWREMYLRCLDERDAKLKALTANIKQSQDKSLPVRMTKLAYVETVAKPPRNIARKQAKNGTQFDVRKPAMTASAKLSTLATAGEAGKVAVPNPGARAHDRVSGHAAKPKKAPLMLKSITSFKNRFKR